jgi:phage gpG-like protein
VKRGESGHPWGDIPARPFLGVSERADKRILKVMNKFFRTDIIK